MSDLELLRDGMRRFTDERDWAQFHDPKSLILALVGEVGELAELFQWLPAGRAQELAQVSPLRQRAGEELSDVLLYLVRLADVLGIDLATAATAKLAAAERRFPPGQASGHAPLKT
jgi:dCTP diphosphatase